MVSWMTSIWPATDSVSEPFNSTFTLGLGNATHLQTCVLKFGCSRIAFHYYSGASLLQSLAGFCCVPLVLSEMHEVVAITCWVRGQICGRTHCACWFWVVFFPPPHMENSVWSQWSLERGYVVGVVVWTPACCFGGMDLADLVKDVFQQKVLVTECLLPLGILLSKWWGKVGRLYKYPFIFHPPFKFPIISLS